MSPPPPAPRVNFNYKINNHAAYPFSITKSFIANRIPKYFLFFSSSTPERIAKILIEPGVRNNNNNAARRTIT